mgnify:FL=1
MKEKLYEPMKKGNPDLVVSYFSNGLSAGIGYGGKNSNNIVRARGESIERFWQKYGPSSDITVYSIGYEDTIQEILFSNIDTTDLNKVDTSGLAFHTYKEEAFNNAILEFCERQSIIAHWKYGTPAKEILIPEGIAIPKNLSNGDIYIREISIFPHVYVVLALYTSNGFIKYAAGASAETSLHNAIGKAMRECAQGYLLMEDNVQRSAQGKKLMDDIQKNYIKYNNSTTINKWPPANGAILNIQKSSRGSIDDILHFLGEQTHPIYVLFDNIYLLGEKYYICRLFSDKWFSGLLDTSKEDFEYIANIKTTRNISAKVPFG